MEMQFPFSPGSFDRAVMPNISIKARGPGPPGQLAVRAGKPVFAVIYLFIDTAGETYVARQQRVASHNSDCCVLREYVSPKNQNISSDSKCDN